MTLAINLLNRVRVNIGTTGTGDVTFGTATGDSFYTPLEAGAADGMKVPYILQEGTNIEEGDMVIGGTGTTGTRTVTKSKIAGVAGTAKINLLGTAVLSITTNAADIMVPRNDLADLSSVPNARTNLGLGGAALLNVGTGAGTVAAGDDSRFAVTAGHGRCRLSLSGGNLILKPFDGNTLIVNGALCIVPDAGVSLAPTGLSSGTDYFIYAVATAGAITALEASTIAPINSTTAGNKGVMIKAGDDTRSLVGGARVVTGPAFSDAPSTRYVRSWFNDPGIVMSAALTANTNVTSTSLVTIAAALQCNGFFWADDIATATFTGGVFANTTPTAITTALSFDSGTVEDGGDYKFAKTSTWHDSVMARATKTGLAAGYHQVNAFGSVSANTATYRGTATPGDRCTLTVTAARGR